MGRSVPARETGRPCRSPKPGPITKDTLLPIPTASSGRGAAGIAACPTYPPVIAAEVAYGGDVESPGFAARHGIPMYGSIAMHIQGWPRNLVLPPYEYQAKRLLSRFDNIRGHVPQDAPSWFEAAYKALATFRQTGELPDDDLQLELLLVEIEMEQLFGHRHEHDVSKAMALLDKVSRLDGEEGEEALRALCKMAAAGKFRGVAIARRRSHAPR